MDAINTGEKGWQKQMENNMSEGKPFTLLTASEDLAKALASGKLNKHALMYFLMGTGIGFTGGFTAARLAGPAGVAGITKMLSNIDPEPVTKTILAAISATAAAAGVYYLYRMVEMLVKGQYNFRITQQTVDGEWVVEAEPARTEERKDVISPEPQPTPA